MEENNTQRDYDKNPIVIQDYNSLFFALLQIPLILIILYVIIYNPYNQDLNTFNLLVIIPFFMMLYIKPYFNTKGKRKTILTNENITF